MFRIVQNRSRTTTDATGAQVTQAPYFWLVCDSHNCGVSARSDIPQLDPSRVDDAASVAFGEFKAEAEKQGWLYAVDRTLCPSCWQAVREFEVRRAEQLRQQMAEAQAKQSQPRSLVQIGGTPGQIKAARELEEKRRKVQDGIRTGTAAKEALQ